MASDEFLTCGEWSRNTEDQRTGKSECKNLAMDWHTCPFLIEIHDDNIKCRCCEDCSGECSDER